MRPGPVQVRSGPRLWFSQTSILAPDLDLSPQTSTFERFGSITSLHCYIVTLLLCYFATLLPCCWRGGGIAALLRIGSTKSNKLKAHGSTSLGLILACPLTTLTTKIPIVVAQASLHENLCRHSSRAEPQMRLELGHHRCRERASPMSIPDRSAAPSRKAFSIKENN